MSTKYPPGHERWNDLTIRLQKEHLQQETQWSQLMCAVALAATMSDERYQRDMLSHAGDLEYDLTGSADHCGRLLEQMDPNDDADAARGKARLVALVAVLRDDRERIGRALAGPRGAPATRTVPPGPEPSDVAGFYHTDSCTTCGAAEDESRHVSDKFDICPACLRDNRKRPIQIVPPTKGRPNDGETDP